MAVDWTGYKIAPDFSGLAQGIAQYGANKQAAAQFQQEMDYKNRTLAADTAYKQQALLGGVNKYAPKGQTLPVYATDSSNNVFLIGSEYDPNTQSYKESYRSITNPDAQPDFASLRIVSAEGLPTVYAGAAAGAGAKKTAELNVEKDIKPVIAGLSKEAELQAVTKKGGQAELEKKLGAENATYFSSIQDQSAQAIEALPNLEATLAFSKDPNVVQGLGAKQRAFVQKVFSDPTQTEKYYTSLSRMATEVLNSQTGTKTENDALRAALDNAQATNTPESNQYLLELLIAQKKNSINKAREANRLYNEGKFTKGNFLEQWGAKSVSPQAAPQGAQPNVIDFGSLK